LNKKWWLGIGLSVMIVGLAACGANTESETALHNQIDIGEKVPKVKVPNASSNDVNTTDEDGEEVVVDKQEQTSAGNGAEEAKPVAESNEAENESVDDTNAPEGISYKGYGTEDEELYQDVQIAKKYAVKNGLVDGIPNVQYEFNYTEGTYHVIRVFEPKDTYETTVAWLAVEKDSKQVYDITVKPLAKQVPSSN